MKALSVLVTRPLAQSERLAVSLSNAGFDPILAPMIKVVELGPEFRSEQMALLDSIATADAVIAISANAFRIANKILRDQDVQRGDTPWFAVGIATAEAMRGEGVEPKIPSDGYDSEGLLAMSELTRVEGKQIIILAGRGGRRMLENVLRERGARVDRVELYERAPLSHSEISVSQEPDVMIAMSGETVLALSQYLQATDRDLWFHKPVVVPSDRVADIAFEASFQKVRVTEDASEQSLLRALSRLASEV